MTEPLDLYPQHKGRVPNWDHSLAGHALALGYISFDYGRLESMVDHLIGALLECSDEVERILVDGMGIRLETRCEILRKLALLEQHPGSDWQSSLNFVMNEITVELAPKRNRLIHDSWHSPGLQAPDEPPSFRQGDYRIFRKKIQSFQGERLTPRLSIDRPLDSLWELYSSIRISLNDLAKLEHWLRNWQTGRGFQESYVQSLLARVPSSQLLPKKVTPARPRRPFPGEEDGE